MVFSFRTVFYLLALIFFALAAINAGLQSRMNLTAAGLFCLTVGMMLPLTGNP